MSLGGALKSIIDIVISDDHKTKRENETAELIKRAETKAIEKMLAVDFIQSADKARYQQVAVNLENEFLKNNDQYPCDITAAYSMLTNWKHTGLVGDPPVADGVNFAQENEGGGTGGASGTNRKGNRDRSNDICRKCGKRGHHALE